MKYDETFKNFKGHLEIWKIFSDGSEELYWEEDNVIVSGMGVTCAAAFSVDGNVPVSSFQANWFQIGTGPDDATGRSGMQVSSTAALSASLDASSYGDVNVAGLLVKNDVNYMASGNVEQGPFAYVGPEFITRVGQNKVMWRIILNDSSCNVSDPLCEIGLFSNNPLLQPSDLHYLVAYRAFKLIHKSSDFSLDFRWTIEF